MATNVGTSPTEVKVEIDTELSDSDISDILDRVEREINRAYSSGTSDFEDSQHRKDFEAVLAALRIAEGRGRRAISDDIGDSSIEYETEEIAQLQKRVRRDDPGNQFGTDGTITRDSDRYSTSTEM